MENNQGLDFSNVSIEKILSGVEQPAPPQEPSVEQTDEKETSSKEEIEQIPVTETSPKEEETSMEEETEVVQEEAEEQQSIFSEVNSLMGMDIDISEFPETVEGFANYAKELSNNLADQTIAQIFNAYPVTVSPSTYLTMFGRTDGLGKMVLPNFCVPLGPRAAGGGPSGTQKLIYFLLARTFHENIFEAKASRKPCENLAKTSRKPRLIHET